MRAFRSALGLAAHSPRWNAARNENHQQRRREKGGEKGVRNLLCEARRRPQVGRRPFRQKVPDPFFIDGKLTDIVVLCEMSHQQIGPTLRAAAELIQLQCRLGRDAPPAHQQAEHTVSSFQVPQQDAPGHGLHLVGIAAAVVGAKDGRPNPGEHFAYEDFLQHRDKDLAKGIGSLLRKPGTDRRSGEGCSRKRLSIPLSVSFLRLPAQRSRRTLDAVQYCSMLPAGICWPPWINTAPWAERRAASSTCSHACMAYREAKPVPKLANTERTRRASTQPLASTLVTTIHAALLSVWRDRHVAQRQHGGASIHTRYGLRRFIAAVTVHRPGTGSFFGPFR